MSFLSVNELALAYGWQKLLDGVTLSVSPGEKVGLVGRNGSGKTSLLKILAGAQPADAGDISRRRGLRVGYLPQEFELDGTKTVRQNIEAGAADLLDWIARYEAGEEDDELLHNIDQADGWNLETRINASTTALAAPPLDTIVGPLSGGEKRRVALCRALVAQPDLLLLDEPTNHLDAESIRWLEEYLQKFPGAVIFVTHDRYFLDVIATRIIELAEGRCYSHPGNYTAYLESKAARQQIAEQAERRRQRFLKFELAWVRSGARAQRTKAQHRMRNYYQLAGQEAPPEERDMDLLLPPPPELGNTVVELEQVGARFADRWVFQNFTLSLKPGQCTGVVGRNGAGKTTLLRLCLGQRAPDTGTVTIGKKVIFNYVDQTRLQLNDANTVLTEIAGGSDTVLFGTETMSARTYLTRFLFPDERLREPVAHLSGGERARLLLAKVLKTGGNVIVLDEPTNDLDLSSLRLLEEALADFEGSVLVVSHDRYFLDRICDQIVAFEDTGVIVQPGNYSYYLEKRKERELPTRPAPPVSVPATPKPARQRKLSFKEQRELDGMEAAILTAESHVSEIETTLNDPNFYSTRAKEAASLALELEKAKAEVARLYARWAELDK
ncbi:MAG: Energy-dependent translational throttle protein EttA [Verrucomicrobiae bacterium]|nr:Energy-dependent translational throttle protein EttA [Verrucomicrobiae bacterium]